MFCYFFWEKGLTFVRRGSPTCSIPWIETYAKIFGNETYCRENRIHAFTKRNGAEWKISSLGRKSISICWFRFNQVIFFNRLMQKFQFIMSLIISMHWDLRSVRFLDSSEERGSFIIRPRCSCDLLTTIHGLTFFIPRHVYLFYLFILFLIAQLCRHSSFSNT